ncbi:MULTISPECIES: SymE family type I addiction module toxin [Kosakonia]|uniref:SymE family type I addiction module toxin n=1 Tax=Kosakonia sacchari TaxID=1158459 RepID=A0ABZ0MNA7_9ENTR|nr:SymE family type I addiction module toxin [Kosakonia sacchari]WOZ76895.1 SymE family type I addiction module toxin [Kosakonia sacchari]
MTVLHSNGLYVDSEVPSFKTRNLTVSYVTRHPKMNQSPAIRIAGDWLEKVGFKIGAQLDVKVTNGCIVIAVK